MSTRLASDELAPGTTFAGCRIERVVGHGGMGVVYCARQLELDRLVALKVIAPRFLRDDGSRERFRREWRIAASLEHPNVLPLYAAGEEDGTPFIIMRFVDGTDLGRLIADEGRLAPSRVANVVAQAAAALDAAHARGLVHRDVKPANLLLDGEHVYLTDFGVAKAVASDSGLTGAGQLVGTIDYMAPEQIHGRTVDLTADIYALGCVLYRALVGRPPYEGENPEAVLHAHLSEEPPAPSRTVAEVPPSFDEVVARALAKDPRQRYQAAGSLAQAASAALESAVVSDADVSEPVPEDDGFHMSVRAPDERTAVFTLRGELDMFPATEFWSAYKEAIFEGKKRALVLDMTDVTFIDSCFGSTIIGALRAVRHRGGNLAILVHKDDALMLRSLQLLGFSGIVPIRHTLDQALAAARAPSPKRR